MDKITKYIIIITFLLLVFSIFHAWFMPGVITGGDYWVIYPSMYKNFPLYPYTWYFNQGNGLGGYAAVYLPIYFFTSVTITIVANFMHFGAFYDRISLLYPILLVSSLSIIVLYKSMFPQGKFSSLSAVIYLTNTYIILLLSGGQMMIGLGYALTPLLLYSTRKLLQYKEIVLLESMLFGCLIAVELFFDIRILYVAMFAIILYVFLDIIISQKNSIAEKIFNSLIFPGFIAILFHSFWILPALIVRENPFQALGSAYSSVAAVRFFSFAAMENSLSLLHPFWPENIFGKTSFMKSEFLFIPVLAFASLLFIKREKNAISIIYLALLGIFAAFLGKGANDPLGNIYVFLFRFFPGFELFRDSTKWYTLIAVSYSLLIPYTFSKITQLVSQKKLLPLILIISFLLFWTILIFPALTGQIKGALQNYTIPLEYQHLEQFLSGQPKFFRTVWVPTPERFGFNSIDHPWINAQDFFSVYDNKLLVKKLSDQAARRILSEGGVKYVIVPDDSKKEIFLKDRKYSEMEHESTVEAVEHISWLKKITGFGNIAVFELTPYRDHFWFLRGEKLTYKSVNQTSYMLNFPRLDKESTLIFSEGFDTHWEAKNTSGLVLHPIRYMNTYMQFMVPKETSKLVIFYTPQKLIFPGIILSIIGLITVLSILSYTGLKKVTATVKK